MTTATKPTLTHSKLHTRLLALSDASSDLLKQDLKAARTRCQRQHCKRLWEALAREEREAIRRKVVANDPLLSHSTGYLIEDQCVRVIETELKQAGNKRKG